MPLLVRAWVAAALLLGCAVLIAPVTQRDAFAREPATVTTRTGAAAPDLTGAAAPAVGAPALMGSDGLSFSQDVDEKARPVDAQIEYSSGTERVWASFAFRDYSGESMSYLVRANGEDWRWGDLDCCEGTNGQFAFPIERRGNSNLGGAAYDVFIYANNAQIGEGGFGVRGTQGFDDSGNDND